MKLRVFYETNNENLEIKTEGCCVAISVATAGIHKFTNSPYPVVHADLKGSDTSLCALL
jgi:hypothetical protein